MVAPTQKYLSDILTSVKKTDAKDPTKEFYEISVNIPDAYKAWLDVSTPDVKNAENRTHLQIIIKDNKSSKMLTMVGDAMVPVGYVLPVFNGHLVTNKTFIFRAADPISVWFEAALYE